MKPLTARQSQVLAMLRRYIASHGYAPTTREIQAHFGFSSQTAAINHVRALERHGALTMQRGMARTIVLK